MLGFIFACILTMLPLAIIGVPWYVFFFSLLLFIFLPDRISALISKRNDYDVDVAAILSACICDYMLYPVYLLAAIMTIVNLTSRTPTTFGIVLIILFVPAFIYKTCTFISCIKIHRSVQKRI